MRAYCGNEELHLLLRELMYQYIVEHVEELERFFGMTEDFDKEDILTYANRLRIPASGSGDRKHHGDNVTIYLCSKALKMCIAYLFRESGDTYLKLISPDDTVEVRPFCGVFIWKNLI